MASNRSASVKNTKRVIGEARLMKNSTTRIRNAAQFSARNKNTLRNRRTTWYFCYQCTPHYIDLDLRFRPMTRLIQSRKAMPKYGLILDRAGIRKGNAPPLPALMRDRRSNHRSRECPSPHRHSPRLERGGCDTVASSSVLHQWSYPT